MLHLALGISSFHRGMRQAAALARQWASCFLGNTRGRINRVSLGLPATSSNRPGAARPTRPGGTCEVPVSCLLLALPFIGLEQPAESAEFAVGLTILACMYRHELRHVRLGHQVPLSSRVSWRHAASDGPAAPGQRRAPQLALRLLGRLRARPPALPPVRPPALPWACVIPMVVLHSLKNLSNMAWELHSWIPSATGTSGPSRRRLWRDDASRGRAGRARRDRHHASRVASRSRVAVRVTVASAPPALSP